MSDEHVSCLWELSNAIRLLLSPSLIIRMHRQISAREHQAVLRYRLRSTQNLLCGGIQKILRINFLKSTGLLL